MKRKDTISRNLNFLGGIFFIVLFLYYIYLTFTLDQQTYLDNYKSVAEQEAVPAVIREFEHYTSSSRHYSRITVNGHYGIGDTATMVVRGVNDYIGKEIKVKILPNGVCIRDSYVFSVRARNRLVYMAIAIILVSLKYFIKRK